MSTVQTHPGVITDEAYQARLDRLAADPRLRDDNTRIPASTFAGLGSVLIGVGVVGLLLTLLAAFVVNGRHAFAAYEVGVFSVATPVLGCLGFLMIFQMMNTHWSVTIRRTMEAIAGMMPLVIALVIPIVVIEIAAGGVLLQWLNPKYEGTFLIEWKEPFLNTFFFVVRLLVYAAFLLFITHRLRSLSLEQDISGDRMLTRKMRVASGWGLPLYALVVAFIGFDFLMALDYRFFSTMWGVYIFAGSAFSGLALTILITALLKTHGRLTGLVTKEHYHDLGKLQFAFIVFWAYIAFSQYFLIWYSNIPEETAYYLWRKNEYGVLTVALVIGHFIIPFFALISRYPKKRTILLAIGAAWLYFFHILDIAWIVRPMVYAGINYEGVARQGPGVMGLWVDVVAVGGVIALFAGILLRSLHKHPLVPMRDPRLPACLQHRNYV